MVGLTCKEKNLDLIYESGDNMCNVDQKNYYVIRQVQYYDCDDFVQLCEIQDLGWSLTKEEAVDTAEIFNSCASINEYFFHCHKGDLVQYCIQLDE